MNIFKKTHIPAETTRSNMFAKTSAPLACSCKAYLRKRLSKRRSFRRPIVFTVTTRSSVQNRHDDPYSSNLIIELNLTQLKNGFKIM